MKQISGKECARVLERNGWELRRVRGSHHVYMKSGSVERISLPMHGNKPLKIGLVKHLMKLAEIRENEL